MSEAQYVIRSGAQVRNLLYIAQIVTFGNPTSSIDTVADEKKQRKECQENLKSCCGEEYQSKQIL